MGAFRKLLGGVAAAGVVVALLGTGALERFELGALSRLFQLRGPRAPTAPPAIGTIRGAGLGPPTGFGVPLPVTRRGAAAVAPVNVFGDRDGEVRRAPLSVGEDARPGFDAALRRVAAAAGRPPAPRAPA